MRDKSRAQTSTIVLSIALATGCAEQKPATDAQRVTGSPTGGPVAAPTPTVFVPPVEPPPAVDPQIAEEEAKLVTWLKEDGVSDASFARGELYSWTTDDSVKELRRTHTLITKTQSTIYGPAMFDRLLDISTETMSLVLRQPSLAKRRFAWSSPWATIMGFPGETYGNRLVRIKLKPDAIIGRFDASAPTPWRFATLDGKEIAEEDVKKEIHRLAAVYHVHKANVKPSGPFFGGSSLREYVLCNESMIEEWSVGTEQTQARLERDYALVSGLAQAAARHSWQCPPTELPWASDIVSSAWPAPRSSDDLRSRVEEVLALLNLNYGPCLQSFQNMGAQLEQALRQPDTLRVTPKTRFGGVVWARLKQNKVPLPPPIQRRFRGSFLE
jgi:hypothetical protein